MTSTRFEFFGTALKRLRVRRGLTQQALADAAGKSRSAIKQFELGDARPSLDTLELLLDALGATLHDLERAMAGEVNYETPAMADGNIAEPEPTYEIGGRRLTRADLERRLDAALDRYVRDALEAEPELTPDELRERRRRAPRPKPAGVRDGD